MGRKFAIHTLMLCLSTGIALPSAHALTCGEPTQNHSAAEAVRQIADVFYGPFEDYPFKPEGVCVNPAFLQVLADVYFRATDGSVPEIESLCITKPSEGNIQIHWSLGPTPVAALLVASGQNEDIVRSHDFWHVAIPNTVCSENIKMDELILERDGGVDLEIQGNNAKIRMHGVSLKAEFPKVHLPKFLSDGIGLDSFSVTEQDDFSAQLSAPLFNIPIHLVGDMGPQDPLSISVFGFRFRVK